MEKAILHNIGVPMFALVELMGHTRYDCALIIPAKIAGMELTSVTFAEEQWSEERRGYRSAIDTKYYGQSAFYCIVPMAAADALAILDALEGGTFARILKLLAPETAVLASSTPTLLAFEKAADLIAMAAPEKEKPIDVQSPAPGYESDQPVADQTGESLGD